MSGFIREHVVKRFTRSSKWPKVRRTHLQSRPHCACCGKKKRLGMQVHHIEPFSICPERELDPTNLLTLCNNARCHLDKGHLGYWQSWNVDVINDCKLWLWKYVTRPRRK